MGYDNQHKWYKLYFPSYRRVFISKDVNFNEFSIESASNEDVDDLDDSFVAPNQLDINSDKSTHEQSSSTQRITRNMTLKKSLFAKIDNKNEPSSFKEASKQEYWMEAMKVEYEALMKNETWDLVLYPNEKNVIGNKWIHKVKFNSVEDIEKYKARLVAKGFAQKYGIDYEKYGNGEMQICYNFNLSQNHCVPQLQLLVRRCYNLQVINWQSLVFDYLQTRYCLYSEFDARFM